MIPNHTEFLGALQEHKKVWLRFYSTADSGVLDRVCAPMDYGPGSASADGLNRYWLWDYASDAGSPTLGLLPQQIVELRVLGDLFDPSEFTHGRSPLPVAPAGEPAPAAVAPSGKAVVPVS